MTSGRDTYSSFLPTRSSVFCNGYMDSATLTLIEESIVVDTTTVEYKRLIKALRFRK